MKLQLQYWTKELILGNGKLDRKVIWLDSLTTGTTECTLQWLSNIVKQKVRLTNWCWAGLIEAEVEVEVFNIGII